MARTLSSDRPFGKCSLCSGNGRPDWISGKIKGAKSGWGWGRCQEKELLRDSNWEAQRSRPETSGWGWGFPSQAGSPFDRSKAGMLGHPVETVYLVGVRGRTGQIPS